MVLYQAIVSDLAVFTLQRELSPEQQQHSGLSWMPRAWLQMMSRLNLFIWLQRRWGSSQWGSCPGCLALKWCETPCQQQRLFPIPCHREPLMFSAEWEGCRACCSQQNGSCMFFMGASVVLAVLWWSVGWICFNARLWEGDYLGRCEGMEQRGKKGYSLGLSAIGCFVRTSMWTFNELCKSERDLNMCSGHAVDTWQCEASMLRLLAFGD